MQLAAATAAKGTYRPMMAGKCCGNKKGTHVTDSLEAELAVPKLITFLQQDSGMSQPQHRKSFLPPL